ncbi:MAG: Universal stress protein family [Actinomycetota bacterium]
MQSSEPLDPRPSTAMQTADVANGEGDVRAARCVLIAVDESPASIATARAALRLMGTNAHYVLVNVGFDVVTWADDPTMWGMVPPAMVTLSPMNDIATIHPSAGTDAAQPDPVGDAEAKAAAVADSAGLVGAEAVGAVGRDRSAAVMEVARDHHADVIVLGKRHRSWLERMFGRSVTDDVLRRAECPVLVVP